MHFIELLEDCVGSLMSALKVKDVIGKTIIFFPGFPVQEM